jgi:hypothetical protein
MLLLLMVVLASLVLGRRARKFLPLRRHEGLLKLFNLRLVGNDLALNRGDQVLEAHLPVGTYEVLLAALEVRPLLSLCRRARNLGPGLHFAGGPWLSLAFCVDQLGEGHLVALAVVLSGGEDVAFVDNAADVAAVVELLVRAVDEGLAVLNARGLRGLEGRDGAHGGSSVGALVGTAAANVALADVLLTLALAVALVEVHDLLELLVGFGAVRDELALEEVFADEDSLLVNDVVELAVVLLEDLVFVVFFVFVVLQVLVAHVEPRPGVFLSLRVPVKQLLQDVLDLLLKLLV